MARVEFKGIVKRFGATVAVERLDLVVAEGEFLVLLGPSGCGKTTTMRMLAGLEAPSEGEVWIGERRVDALEPKDRDVAMVFQSYGLYPNMTVAENIGFPLKIRGRPAAEVQAAVREAAAQVELGELLTRRPKELSGGQRQRVALARAIVRRPAVFLMDEPLSNLDAKLRGSMRAYLKHLHHSLGVTTIYVTHDQVEAMTLADRIVVMSRARVQQIGTPREVYDRPANLFVAGFVGAPPMNLLPGRLQGGRFVAPGADMGWPSAGAPGAEVVLGVRAEDLGVLGPGEAPPAGGTLRGEVFATELTGDSTWVTVSVGTARVTAKAGRGFAPRIGEPLVLGVPRAACHLFRADGGARLGQSA
jgi:multiple sugar transport system ATP-binding protein